MVELRECGFCGQFLDNEEELIPIYAGDPPKPQPQTARGFVEADRQVIGRRGEMGEVQVLGYEVDEIAAILDALERSDMIEFETKRAVEEVRAVGGEVKALAEATVDSSKVGAAVTVDAPQLSDPEPDLEVCRYCFESFAGGSDDG